MAGLTLALNNALSALNVNQHAMAVLSHNIANANTEGYSRQVVDLASVTYDGTGQGVRIEEVSRKVDEFLLTAIQRQTSLLGQAEVTNEYMDRLQTILGDPSAQNSIDAQIETFFNDLQSMAETPERTSTRTSVVEAGANLAREISNLAYGIENLRKQADTDLANNIKTVNETLKKLYLLNEAITHANAFGTSKATLFDQRDEAIKKISDMMDVHAYQSESGATHIYVGRGIPLLDESLHQLSYAKADSLQAFVEDSVFNPVILQEVTPSGEAVGSRLELITGGKSSDVSALFTKGKMAALLEMRDKTFPSMLEQIDTLASVMRDQFNLIHNKGAGYPPATELTGTREVTASQRIAWEGSVRIAAMDISGRPLSSAYLDETSGVRPLLLNLDTIFNGLTYGEPTTQDIIKEINSHFGIPQNRLELGNMNQIQLALSSDDIPGASNTIDFDFDLENISGRTSDFWVSNIQVLDDTATDITSTTNTMPSVALSPTNTFSTTAGSDLVQIATAGMNHLQVGDRVKLSDPGVPIDIIPGAQFDDYFVIEAVTATGFTVRLPTLATSSTMVSVASQTAIPPYGTAAAGEKKRIQQNGSISADLNGNPASRYYDVNVTMTVRDANGTLSNSVVTYRVLSPAADTRNTRIAATAVVSGSATLVQPQTSQGYLRAMMVDADGIELPRTNGEYGDQSGFLKIVSNNPDITFAMDELNSEHKGLPTDNPPRPGSNRGFSFFYELNNFFQSNQPTDTGDTLRNAAYYMAVEERFNTKPSLLSTGNLQLSNQPANTSLDPLYTYERFSGDNSIAQQLAKVGLNTQQFSAAGGLSESSLTLNGYAGEMLGYFSAQTAVASADVNNQQTLLKGYQERASAISGVNLDEELGNTIIYQNAYSASAKVISTTDQLFQTLLDAV